MKKYLQRLGASLMVPVAVLPAAAILMGIGYWIESSLTHSTVVSTFLLKSGGALIDNMGLLFAVGIAYGLSKDKNGAAALTGLVGWLMIQTLLSPDTLATFLNTKVELIHPAFSNTETQFIGILIGIISAEVYNLTYQVKLPTALSFFSGRRLSAIVNSVVMMFVAIILMFIWPTVFGALVNFGEFIAGFGSVGAGFFGLFNRLLIPLGLHHALNSVFWFDVAGINDIPNYLSGEGVPGITGIYQAGFFPIMMFGLPAAALAIFHEARIENRAKIGGLLLGGAVASFFTGITEPLEFTFMFVAPILFVFHAIFTGFSLFISAAFQWIAGFGFSAGLVDYVLSFKNPLAINNLFLILQGIFFAAIYYGSFRFLIRKLNLKTPGRGEIIVDETDEIGDDKLQEGETKYSIQAQKILDIIGKDNLKDIDYCTTRLRLVVTDSHIYKDEDFKKVGALGVVRPAKDSLQIIIGTEVQFVADALKKITNL